MGKKSIIELEDNESVYKTIIANGYPMLQVIVPSPYAEPDLEQVRNEAFKNGYDAACKDIDIKSKTNAAYQKGLSDAWEAARKIADTTYDVERKIFDCCDWDVVKTFTAAEAIEKLKQYDQEKQEEIKVGDEVDAPFGKAVVLDVTDNAVFYLYAAGGTGWEEPEYVRKHKTGRNFAEITTALEKLRGEQEQ